ncbi:peroxide stress protein YaaA [Tateyamaria sp.]|uniref:peroxide stress protein YaaA n=1 Tax=Tateyamaria sp. TaxID=1929288 RepID=UPI00329F5DE9
MLVVISPAKRLDWAEQQVQSTAPAMQEDAVRLARTARNLTLGNLKGLMDLSDDLARLNRDRFAAFEEAPDVETTRPAMFAFAGDTYQGVEAGTLTDDQVAYAQDHLRILSGLYGLLRPLDAIQPYRLEMGSKLKTRRGTSLYDYWRGEIAKAINLQADVVGTDMLVNCASQEYFGAVPLKTLKPQVITPVFMEDKGAGPKIVSFFAKRARGAMARHVVQNEVRDLDGLRAFETDGYRYQPKASDDQRLVFVRPYPA